jgi:hypothetical protein
MSRIQRPLLSLLVVLAVVFVAACGGSDDSAEPSTQRFASGDYDAASMVLSSWNWNAGATTWEYAYYTLEQVSLTINRDGVTGTATVTAVQPDADNQAELTTPGDDLNGFTVGDTVTITGRADGSVLSLRLASESGGMAVAIFVPYDGEISDFDADRRFLTVDTMAGTADVEGTDTHASTDVYLYGLTRTSDANSTPTPVDVALPTGGTSIYADGTYLGGMYLYLTVYDEMGGAFTYEEIDFDVDVVVSGQSITGTATLTAVDGDAVTGMWEGFTVGEVFTLTGAIASSAISWDLGANGFTYPIVTAPYDFSNYDFAPGSIETIDVEYGAAYDTDESYAGEVELDLLLN